MEYQKNLEKAQKEFPMRWVGGKEESPSQIEESENPK